MLTHNIDVCDGLTNGSQGEVIDFIKEKNREIKYILVKFDDIQSGRQRRKNFHYDSLYPDMNVTPIELKETNFPLSKKKTSASSTATAIQFPIRLAYAATAHKIQGHTVKKPHSLVVDLETWLQPAMAYVMLSRIQTLSQLFIVGSIPVTKIRPWMQALAELERMNSIALNDDNECSHFKILSLNVCSLRKHMEDVRHDYDMKSSNVICLQETWLHENEENDNSYQLANHDSHFITCGRGKGIVTYFTLEFIVEDQICNPQYQITKISSPKLDVLNVYRSGNAGDSFIHDLNHLLSSQINKTTILCGDLNFCVKKHPRHPIKLFLEKLHFIQIVEQPTHIDGGVLDHIYILCNTPHEMSTFETRIKGCYYSDHDKNLICLKE